MRRLGIIGLVLLPGMAMGQTDDRSYLTALLEDNLSGAGRQVVITGFAGALSSKATIAELTIADDAGVWLTLRDVALDWNRSALLAGNVSVNALTAGEIIVARRPLADASALPSPEASGFKLPELPVSVEIGTIAAERIELGAGVLGTALEGNLTASLSLAGGEGTGALLLERTDAGPEGRVALTASYGNASGQLAIDLDAQEAAGGIAATLLGLPGGPSVELTVKGAGPISDYTADVRLASDGAERLAGQVTLLAKGEAGQAFAADLGGDLAPLFLPEYAAFFGPEVRLRTKGLVAPGGRLDLNAFAVETRAMVLNGALVVAADGLPERFALTGKLGLDGEAVLLPLTTEVKTYVQDASVALAFDATKGDGWRGTVVANGLKRDDFVAGTLAVLGSGRISRMGGKQQVGGTLTFAGQGLVPTDAGVAQALGDKVDGVATFFWQEGAALSLPKLALNGEGYGVTAGGQIDGLTLTGRATALVEDMGRAALLAGRPLAGKGVATVNGTANLLAGSFDGEAAVSGTDLRVGQAELDSLLRGASEISASVKRDETGTTLRRLDLRATGLQVTASGTVASAGSDLAAELAFDDLASLGGAYSGSLKGRAHFTGTMDAGAVTLDADGNGLAIGQPEVDALLGGPSVISLVGTLRDGGLDLAPLQVKAASLSAVVKGRVDPDGNDLSADLLLRDLESLGGGYRGALAGTASFKGTSEDGVLTLNAKGDGLGIGRAEVDSVLRGQSVVTADLAVKGGQIKINAARISNPQLNADATGEIAGAVRKVKLSAQLANLGILLPEFPGALTVTGTAMQDGAGTVLDLKGIGPGQIDATVTGRLAGNYASGQLAIKGTAQAGLANAFITPRSVSGPVRFDLGLNGPLALRSLSGRVSLSDGRISDPGQLFALEGVTGTADLTAGQMRVSAEAGVSTGGRATMGGSIGLAAPYVADLSVTLGRVTLKDPQLYETIVRGAVTVSGPLAGGAVIGGDLVLDETELRIPSTGLGGSGSLPDLRHVNEPGDVRATRVRAGLVEGEGSRANAGGSGRPFPLDLRVSAPNRVFVRGRGLDAELGGELRLGGTTANVVPSGAFNLIRGRLDILGKRLDLSEALLQLEGEFVPFVRILASNESDGIVSSVLIEGQATEPKVSFVSAPELPEEEVLARLLFGRGLTNLSALQAAQLAGAVATLAGKGGDGIVGKLRKGFGLDDLDLVTNAEGGASVKAGKYISRNVYTEVIVDQAGKSQINLNLDITPTITLRGSTSTDGTTGIGIFKEKDY